MLEAILTPVALWIKNVISAMGYAGIALLMAIESANIVLPSEIIMPFSGYLVFDGKFTMICVTMAGSVGNLVGSIASYYLGYFGGRPFIEKYGRFVFMKKHDLDAADRWFTKHGEATVFFTRMMPIIRTFISLPAGISRMNFPRFCVLTFVGCIPWCWFLAYVGLKAGENWDKLGPYFHYADYAVSALLLFLIIRWILSKRRNAGHTAT